MKANPLIVFGGVAILGAVVLAAATNANDPAALIGIAGAFVLVLGLIKQFGRKGK